MANLIKCSRCGLVHPAELLDGLCMDCVIEITLGRGSKKIGGGDEDQGLKDKSEPPSPPQFPQD